MKKIIIIAIVSLAFCFSNINIALSWDDGTTHRLLSEYATDNSVLNDTQNGYLIKLGFSNELTERLRIGNEENSILEWIAKGAELEDNTPRYLNHFHDPTAASWDLAGLNDVYSGKSSLLWAQDGAAQGGFLMGGDHSWQKVRQVYYWALTATTKELREVNFAQTFLGLGYQMHLLQDTAVPAHVRNDAHPIESALKKSSSGDYYFEAWAADRFIYLNDIKAFAPDPDYPSVSFDVANGYAPITQLYDTDTYSGTNPSTALSQGLAEYTNANFFSTDTVFAKELYAEGNNHYFPYPSRTSTNLQEYIDETAVFESVIAEDGTLDGNVYIRKTADGELIEHFVRTSKLTRPYLNSYGEGERFYKTFFRDDECHNDYAQKLIPRAVGYSAGLLDYFFRGDINLVPDGNSGGGYVIKNNTSEVMDGTFELYYGDPDQRQSFNIGKLFIPANGTSGSIALPQSGNNQYTLVFSGRLGNEDGAVAGRFIPSYNITIQSSKGTVTNSTGDINCGSVCSQDYIAGTMVTLTAMPDSGATFAGWLGGGCTGIGTCVVTMDASKTVTAVFSTPAIWTIDTLRNIGTFGGYTSIATDSFDNVYINYHEKYLAGASNVRYGLYYATNSSGIWSYNHIDSYTSVLGKFNSIAIDKNGKQHVSYIDEGNSSIMYASNVSGIWSWISLEYASIGDTSIAVDSSGNVHISYYDGSLKYITNASGAWVTETIHLGVGTYSSIALDSNDKVHISYDNGSYVLMHATNASGTWVQERITNNTGGMYSSIAVDSSDKIHIGFTLGYSIPRYATNADVLPGSGNCYNKNWNCSVVDSAAAVTNSSLSLDSNGNAHVSYYNLIGSNLKYATNSSGLWTNEVVGNSAASAGNASIAVDSSNVVHISYKNTLNQLIHAFANLQ